MRDIKFRAWHKCEKKMLNLTKINFLSGAAWSDPESKPHIMCHENPECCILMQFTGLKDKNGKEIYEGDIANITKTLNPVVSTQKIQDCVTITERGVMHFNEKEAQFSFYVKDSLMDERDAYLEVTIIGDIFSNPELLEPPLGNNAEPIRKISEDDWRKDDR